MITAISIQHQERFEQIRKSLQLLGCSEANFIKVELLFYEALSISKDYGSETGNNSLLSNLRQVLQDQYEKAKAPTAKRNQRELHIRKFIIALKKVLSNH